MKAVTFTRCPGAKSSVFSKLISALIHPKISTILIDLVYRNHSNSRTMCEIAQNLLLRKRGGRARDLTRRGSPSYPTSLHKVYSF